MRSHELQRFVQQSNYIEGIFRAPLERELEAHDKLLAVDVLSVRDLRAFTRRVQPGAVLRDQPGLDVFIRGAEHRPIPGGWQIEPCLRHLLNAQPGEEGWPSSRDQFAYQRHVRFETLHPFTDGNGRCGRALWLHDMGGLSPAMLDFLHLFYYQALDAFRVDAASATIEASSPSDG